MKVTKIYLTPAQKQPMKLGLCRIYFYKKNCNLYYSQNDYLFIFSTVTGSIFKVKVNAMIRSPIKTYQIS